MRFTAFPIAFATLGLGILVLAALGTLNPLAVVLAAASLLAVLARLVLTLRENAGMLVTSRHEALTDALTGLGNRRALTRDLDRVADARHDGAVLGALRPRRLQALQRLLRPSGRRRAARAPRGQARRRTSPARGIAYRMGGDEFCVLLDVAGDARRAGRRAAPAALTEHGDGLHHRAARSAPSRARARPTTPARPCASPTSACTPTRRGGRTLGAQPEPRRPAARAGRARPRPGEHISDVAELAEAVAQRAGPRRRADRRTSATPPSCTTSARSPSPTRSSTSPARSTTPSGSSSAATPLIGERIVAAAPALRPVATLVRSSHERWDGGGLPRRPRRRGRSRWARASSRSATPSTRWSPTAPTAPAGRRRRPRRARRCAGTQFDPAVVAAFAAAWATQAALRVAA